MDEGHFVVRRATARDWWGLAILTLPCLLYSMDLTVLNLAVPHLTVALAPSGSQLLWIVDIYGFVLAGALITMGAIGDRIGRRRLLLIGAAAFGLTSVLAAFAPTAWVLIAARALLGLAAATLAPSTLSLISNIFRNDRQRRFAIGVWMASFSLGGAIGPLIGGALLEHFWWGSVFLLSVPVMLLLLVAGPILLPEYKDPESSRIDLLGALLSLTAMLALVYGIKHMVVGDIDPISLLALAAGLLIGTVFVHLQLKSSAPMLDVRLFTRTAFAVPVLIYFIGLFVSFGTLLLLAQYLQLVLGMSPFEAGLWTLFSAAGFLSGSLAAPSAAGRWGVSKVIPMSLGLAFAGFSLLAWSVLAGAFTLVLAAAFLMALGVGPVLTLSTDLIVGAVPPERAGSAAAIAETSSELGGALGIAIMGSLAIAVYRREIALSLDASVPSEIRTMVADNLAAANQALSVTGDTGMARLASAATAAFNAGFAAQAGICAGVVLMALLSSLALRRSRR
jgi:DHA2 family multidrug resistance protein-like MFS transporter